MNATSAAIWSSERSNGGIPFSRRPLRTTGPILSPFTSAATNLERVRSGPLSPPVASRPWQNEQSCRNRAFPFWTSSGEYVFSAEGELAFDDCGLCVVVCAEPCPILRRQEAARSRLNRKNTRCRVIGSLSVPLPQGEDETLCCPRSYPIPT